MPYVRMKLLDAGPNGVRKPGQVVEVSEKELKQLKAAGAAEEATLPRDRGERAVTRGRRAPPDEDLRPERIQEHLAARLTSAAGKDLAAGYEQVTGKKPGRKGEDALRAEVVEMVENLLDWAFAAPPEEPEDPEGEG